MQAVKALTTALRIPWDTQSLPQSFTIGRQCSPASTRISCGRAFLCDKTVEERDEAGGVRAHASCLPGGLHRPYPGKQVLLRRVDSDPDVIVKIRPQRVTPEAPFRGSDLDRCELVGS
jgi:hypothetical protein